MKFRKLLKIANLHCSRQKISVNVPFGYVSLDCLPAAAHLCYFELLSFLLPIILLFLVQIERATASEPRRLSSVTLDLSTAHEVYLSHDLVASVKFPYPITEAKVGNPQTVTVLISKTLQSELTLRLTSRQAGPTNLIVRCGKRVFVLDLVPSSQKHQDYVRITGSYSEPEYASTDAVLTKSSDQTRSLKGAQLIDSSERYQGSL